MIEMVTHVRLLLLYSVIFYTIIIIINLQLSTAEHSPPLERTTLFGLYTMHITKWRYLCLILETEKKLKQCFFFRFKYFFRRLN